MKHKENNDYELINNNLHLIKVTEKLLIKWAVQLSNKDNTNKNYYETALFYFSRTNIHKAELNLLNNLINQYLTEQELLEGGIEC